MDAFLGCCCYDYCRTCIVNYCSVFQSPLMNFFVRREQQRPMVEAGPVEQGGHRGGQGGAGWRRRDGGRMLSCRRDGGRIPGR